MSYYLRKLKLAQTKEACEAINHYFPPDSSEGMAVRKLAYIVEMLAEQAWDFETEGDARPNYRALSPS